MSLLGKVISGAKALTGFGEWEQTDKSLDDQMLGGGLDGGSANRALVVLRGTVGDMSRLFVKRRVLLLRQYAEHSEPVRAALDIYRNCIEQAEWQVVPYDQTRPMNESVRAEIKAVLATPNGFEPYSTVKGKFTEDFLVVGHGSMELGINRDTTPWGIFPLDAERVAFVPGWDGTDASLPRYCELTFDRQVKRWLPDQMCMTLVNRPRSYDLLGLSHVELLDTSIRALLQGSDQFLQQLIDRTPGGAFDLGEGYTKEQVDAFRQEIQQIRNFFAVISGGKNSKFIPFNASERDLKALDKLLFFKRMVAAIFQLPLAMLGELVDASRANTESLLENADKGPGALLWRIKEMENLHLTRKWGPVSEHNCMIDYPIMSRRDEKLQSEVSEKQTGQVPWVTINQAARDAGKPTFDLPIADEPLLKTQGSYIPLSALNAQYFDESGKLKEPEPEPAPEAPLEGEGDTAGGTAGDAASGKRLTAGARLMLRSGLPFEHVVRKSAHQYSTTQVDLPGDVADEIIAFGEGIPDGEVAGDGREARPHVTIKYGLETNSADDVREALKGVKPFTLTLGKTAVFEGEEFDVVIVEVKGAALKRLNQKIADALEHTDTHPEYVPHATIAYVQSGKGEGYSGDDFLSGTKVKVDAVTFCNKSGKRTVIPLDSEE
jgi:2'-5' RNA ligase